MTMRKMAVVVDFPLNPIFCFENKHTMSEEKKLFNSTQFTYLLGKKVPTDMRVCVLHCSHQIV